MACWLIAEVHITDGAKLMGGYVPASAKLVEEMGGKYAFRGRGGQVLEGDGPDGAALIAIEWPDKETALKFWNSPEYAEVKKLREGAAEIEVSIYEN